ncbi:YciI family protein [Parasphingorhabdus sp.]|uniref:YciI family protein n=1 Tax=Parasphingorhabdus sp. TaxID=2709688 RepID=UPI003FA6ECF6
MWINGWGKHVTAHIAFLKWLIDTGQKRASGPVTGLGKRAGFIIMTVADADQARSLIEQDPFAIEGLIDELTILEWNPLFGSLARNDT